MKYRTKRLLFGLFKIILVLFVMTYVVYYIYRRATLCTSATFDETLAYNQTWRPVNKEKTAFVFSAYMVKGEGRVVILGAMSAEPVVYRCILWLRDDTGSTWHTKKKVPSALILPEGHDKRYSPVMFKCPADDLSPVYVSLVTDMCGQPLNIVRIQNIHLGDENARRFTVCLTPLHFKYARAYELIEWVELNKIMGAEKFIIYNYSTASNVDEVLKYYSKRSLVKVVPWRLPFSVDTYPYSGVEPEIHYFAQSVSLNDCLYRNKGQSEYIVNIDLDEFIVPKSNGVRTWSEMLAKVNNRNAKAYTFRSSYFRKDWINATGRFGQNEARQFKLTTLEVFDREDKVFIKGVKSKYIVRTDATNLLMIHFVLDVTSHYDVTVSETVALLHHYRNLHQNVTTPKNFTTDFSVLQKYGKELLANVRKVWKDLSHVISPVDV